MGEIIKLLDKSIVVNINDQGSLHALGLGHVCDAIVSNRSAVSKLNLSRNHFDFEKALILAGLMQNVCLHVAEKHSLLKDLILQTCQMNNEEVASLFRGLSSNNTLKGLDLSDNKFTSEALGQIAEPMRENKTLIKLILDGNNLQGIGKTPFFSLTNIKNMQIEQTNLDDEDIEALVKRLS